MSRQLLLVITATIVLLAGCSGTGDPVSANPFPSPTCGGAKIKIEGAISCEKIVEIAIAALRDRASDQLARGVAAIDVFLTTCPRDEVPPQIDCGREPFVQLVTVTFKPPGPGGPIEPSLTVAIAPVTGTVLGISNPLIR